MALTPRAVVGGRISSSGSRARAGWAAAGASVNRLATRRAASVIGRRREFPRRVDIWGHPTHAGPTGPPADGPAYTARHGHGHRHRTVSRRRPGQDPRPAPP